MARPLRPTYRPFARSARARSSAAASTPQNLTSGRRSRRLAPKFLMPEGIGLEGRNQSLSRHLAARTLCGPPAEIRRDQLPCRWRNSMTLYAGLGRLQHCALRHFPVCQVAPERDQQAAGKGHDRDPTDPSTLLADACTEPAAQLAVGLMPHPQPSQLDHDMAQAPIAGFRDTLFPGDRAAAPRRRHQPGIGGHCPSVGKLATKALMVEHRSNLRTDRLELYEKATGDGSASTFDPMTASRSASTSAVWRCRNSRRSISRSSSAFRYMGRGRPSPVISPSSWFWRSLWRGL